MIQEKNLLTNGKVDNLVVFLHGYGANGQDILDLGNIWLDSIPNIGFYAPDAPRQCTVNKNEFQWFGLEKTDFASMRQGLSVAAIKLERDLQEILNYYELRENNLILAGFSQGAMLSLEMINHNLKLAGIISYAGAFYPKDSGKKLSPLSLPPVLLVHGTDDTVVFPEAMESAKNNLQQWGVKVSTLLEPHIPHTISLNGVQAGVNFTKSLLN